jgi:hypothetical protein
MQCCTMFLGFVYFIHEGKVRAPAAAMALIERLGA